MISVCTNTTCPLAKRCGKVLKGEIDPTLRNHYKFHHFKPVSIKNRTECREYVRV